MSDIQEEPGNVRIWMMLTMTSSEVNQRQLRFRASEVKMAKGIECKVLWCRHLPEVVAAVGVSKERHSVRHHPYIAALAVEVRFAPMTVLVIDVDNVVILRRVVSRVVVAVHRDTCNE